ncbi:MAG TPA: nucleotidyltransferase domain-containing protein [Kofleriaceae bacterium]
MPWRAPPYDRAVAEAEAFIRATWQVHGVVVAGSIVRGEAGPTSDLDIFIVHAEPWRVRDQRRFAGVPAELFVNPAERIRGYFKNEHADGRPCTAHMFATGVVLDGAEPIVDELVREAREWLAKPIELTPAELASKRYGAVDTLDDARDLLGVDPAMAELLFANAVQDIVAYAFWQRARFQPRRKDLLRVLATIDPVAADHVRAFAEARGDEAARIAIALANHVLGVDTFFEWTSDRS